MKNRREKEKNRRSPLTWATPARLTSPAGPAQPPRLASSSPRPEAARWNACSTPPTPPTSPGHLLLPPRHLFTPGDAQTATASIPPLPRPPPPLRFASSSTSESSPERTAVENRGHLPPQPLPPC